MTYAMSAAGSSARPQFDEEALKRGVTSVGHPLTRALLVLTFTTGLIDGVSYLGLGRVFTANMTGNVVLLGFGVARSGGLPVVAPLLSLLAFVVGAAAGGALVKRLDKRHPTLVAQALAMEVAFVATAAIVAAATTVKPGHAAAYVLIVLLALAMGSRSTVVRRLSVPDLSTVVLTMTLSAFAAESPLAGGSGRGATRRLTAVVTMFAGAVTSALLLKTSLVIPLALAAVMALLTWLVYVPVAVRRGR
jgi:uncharacterized membrane protein YoaK (UPF0700 family)